MIEKLRSHLKKTRGFTLVELLIVIAIIAILVLIVIIALNPLQRIHDANDSRASNSVRSVAIAIEGCLTRNNLVAARCNSLALLNDPATEGAPWVRDNIVEGTGVGEVTIAGDPIVVCSTGGSNVPAGDPPHWWTWTSAGGEVEEVDVSCHP